MIRDDQLRVSGVYEPDTYVQGWVRPNTWQAGGTPTGAVTSATAAPQQQAPLATQPVGQRDDPVQFSGPISVIDFHGSRDSHASTVSPASHADIGGLGRGRTPH